jgi:hypothetical protein
MSTAIKTRPPTVTPQIRPTKIQMIIAIKTTPAVATLQIRPTKNTNDYSNQNETTYCYTTNKTYKYTNVELSVPDNE